MFRRRLPALLLAAACEAPLDDPGPVVLPDDDSAASDPTPTPAVALGLWSVGGGPETPPSASIDLWAIDGDELAPWSPFAVRDGRPIPGGLALPGVSPPLPEGEGCAPLRADDVPAAPLGAALDAAFVVRDSSTGTEWVIPSDAGHHRWDGPDGPSGTSLDLRAPGQLGFETGAFSAPPSFTGVLPLSGPVGNLANLQFTWNPEPSMGVEILLLRLPNQADPSSFEAVRCLFADDGIANVDASPLAAAGTGDVFVELTRIRVVEGTAYRTATTRSHSLRLWPTR